MIKNNNLIVCGAGPAGMGFLFAAYKANRLRELIKFGLTIIDKDLKPGSGDISLYKITANTTTETFTKCITESDPDGIFLEILNDEMMVELIRDKDKPISLKLAGNFLQVISEVLLKHIQNLGGVVLNNTIVSNCCKGKDGLYKVEIKNDRKEYSLITKKLLINFGGWQDKSNVLEKLQESDYLNNVKIDCKKVIMSNDILCFERKEISDEVTVIGGSHSAFSVIERLAKGGLVKKVNLIYYPPIRIHYTSEKEANADNYSFDRELDVCPLNGMVNRYGGLRFKARDIVLSVLNTSTFLKLKVRLLEIEKTNLQIVREIVSSADCIVPCFGYQPRFPTFKNEFGESIAFKYENLCLVVDSTGCVCTEDGQRLENVFSFGIGSGVKASEDFGGEKSFNKRVDGVWLYHNDIGNKIIKSIFGE